MPIKRTSTDSSKKPIKRGRQKEVVYDILIECSALMKDEFWKQFYEDLSVGKSTKGIYITNGVVQTSNKRNGFIYTITDKAPEVIVVELHHLLTTHTGICSRKDMNKKKQFVKEISQELKEYDQCKWTSIKRKNIRTMLLVDYAIHLNKIHSLSWPATISAYQTIINAFESKTHSSKDVIYSNGKVRSIVDIDISDDGLSMVNIRQECADENLMEECVMFDKDNKITSSNAISLQGLFEPYLAAWMKTI